MKFLIDNAISPRLAKLPTAAGHDAVHVRDYGMEAAKDGLILDRAATENRIVVSADTDFGTLLAARRLTQPSFILFRDSDLNTPEEFSGVLLPSLPFLENEVEDGFIAVFRSGRLRLRKLPIFSG